MSTLNQRAEDTVVASLLAGFWSGMLMDKLAVYTLRWNMPVLHQVAQWWPALLIVAGLVVLARHKQQRAYAPDRQIIVMPRQQQVVTMQPRKEQVHAR